MKNLVKRVRKIERCVVQPRWRVVVKDCDGLYRGECGNDLPQEQFDAWVKLQDKDTQVIIVEVCENFRPEEGVVFWVENHADKNLGDVLGEYDEALRQAAEANLRSETAALRRKLEREGKPELEAST